MLLRVKLFFVKYRYFYIYLIGLSVAICSCNEVVHLAPPKRSCDEALTNWTITRPNFPTTVLQNDLVFIDDITGFAVGNSGTILKTKNSGHDWEIQEQFFLSDGHLNPDGLSS